MGKDPERVDDFGESYAEELTESAWVQRGRKRGVDWKHVVLVLVMVYLFVVSIKLMGHGLKVAAKDPAAEQQIHSVFEFADNPFAALCVGILVTSLVQSSSFTTSLTVLFVGAGEISLPQAIPIIMGANIGTSVTNLLVSVGHIRHLREFRRALAGAAVHDFFNVCCVALFFPLEQAFHIIERLALALGEGLRNTGWFNYDPDHTDFVGTIVAPFKDGADWMFMDLLNLSKPWAGGIISALAIVMLFVVLVGLVRALRAVMMNRVGDMFANVLFARPWTSFAIGIVATTLVQSSSVTTSLAVPLVAAGVLKLRQVYPYTLGANIGTTVTALLAALANANSKAGAMGVAAAVAHLIFNIFGTSVFWPLQRIPISLAKGYAKAACRRRILVATFLLGFFFVLPITVIVVTALLR